MQQVNTRGKESTKTIVKKTELKQQKHKPFFFKKRISPISILNLPTLSVRLLTHSLFVGYISFSLQEM